MITDDLWAILEPLVIQVINDNLHEVCAKRNQSRTPRLVEEVRHLKALPARRQESVRTMKVKVQSGSTISVERNIDSVPARLIGESVEASVAADTIAIWYGSRNETGRHHCSHWLPHST